MPRKWLFTGNLMATYLAPPKPLIPASNISLFLPAPLWNSREAMPTSPKPVYYVTGPWLGGIWLARHQAVSFISVLQQSAVSVDLQPLGHPFKWLHLHLSPQVFCL